MSFLELTNRKNYEETENGKTNRNFSNCCKCYRKLSMEGLESQQYLLSCQQRKGLKKKSNKKKMTSQLKNIVSNVKKNFSCHTYPEIAEFYCTCVVTTTNTAAKDEKNRTKNLLSCRERYLV